MRGKYVRARVYPVNADLRACKPRLEVAAAAPDPPTQALASSATQVEVHIEKASSLVDTRVSQVH